MGVPVPDIECWGLLEVGWGSHEEMNVGGCQRRAIYMGDMSVPMTDAWEYI